MVLPQTAKKNEVDWIHFFVYVYSCCYIDMIFVFLLVGPESKEKLIKPTQTAIFYAEGDCVIVQNQVYTID